MCERNPNNTLNETGAGGKVETPNLLIANSKY